MSLYAMDRARLGELYEALGALGRVYLPTRKNGASAFLPYGEEGSEADLSLLLCDKSPKDLFFPQSEELVKFRLTGAEIALQEAARQKEPFVLFGVKACDLQAIEVLDRVFLAEPVDSFYQSRREHATVVALACARPAESCFCTAFGIDPTSPQGPCDAVAWLTESALYLRPCTEKGETIVSCFADFAPADEKEVAAQQAAARAVLGRLPYGQLDLSRFGGASDELALFDHPAWEELSAHCLGCGSCTFSCPTCQCYDIRDYDTGKGVLRFRCWDSCMYKDFTMMAHGTPRKTQKERFRQRFLHKLAYYPKNNGGLFSCVGCGRCVKKCPANLHMIRVAKALGGEPRAQ